MENASKEIALQILNENNIGVMATNNGGRPNSRYMTFEYVENKLYTVAKQNSDVVNELKEIAATHILLGYERGSVKAGKYADFVILDKNILDYQGEELRTIGDTKILNTYFEGENVYSAK